MYAWLVKELRQPEEHGKKKKKETHSDNESLHKRTHHIHYILKITGKDLDTVHGVCVCI